MRWLADGVYAVLALLYIPVALYNALILGKNRTGWAERFGRLPSRDPDVTRVWIHAVSLGEINATPRLAEMFQRELPDAQIVFSTTTDTGFQRAVQLFGRDRVFRYPLDFSWMVARALDAVRPSMIVLVELEVWPNLVCEAARRAIPVVVVNGRLTVRSAKRLMRLGGLIRSVFSKLVWVGAQDEAIAARFRGLGVDPQRIEITGSVKWDTAVVAEQVPGDKELATAVGLDHLRPVIVCGSTGPGEEKIILDAFQKVVVARGLQRAPRLIIVPRKPERFNEVAGLIERSGFSCVRRSTHPNGGPTAKLTDESVILGDTMGELRAFYSLAQLVFIGRSLVPMGGSDPMEVAGLGKPILTGPHVGNFEQPVTILAESGTLKIVDSVAALVEQIQGWLDDPVGFEERGKLGRDVVVRCQGATLVTVRRLAGLLQSTRTSRGTFQSKEFGVGSGKVKPYNS
jgi:3-deoxy-D-manno-octulosonic-acid transferase